MAITKEKLEEIREEFSDPDFAPKPKAIAATGGAIYNELSDIYTKLYQISAVLGCAIPGLEHGEAPAIDAAYLCRDLVGDLAEKLDLLSSRICH
jgi:hypothetical protein